MTRYTITNRAFISNRLFKVACSMAHIPPSKRQASKWRNRRGLAYRERSRAMRELNKPVIPPTGSE